MAPSSPSCVVLGCFFNFLIFRFSSVIRNYKVVFNNLKVYEGCNIVSGIGQLLKNTSCYFCICCFYFFFTKDKY